jgi:carotenoid 1,2-hydratase
MISLRFDPRFPAPEALTAPGGFVWWYLDLTDGAGNGVVLIWSFGLPFLPGYADAARRGQGQPPASRPSLNVAVYKGGWENVYLLQEYPPESVTLDIERGELRIGRSTLRSWVEGQERRVLIMLDCPVPGSAERLTGRVEARGPAVYPVKAPAPHDDPHAWTPMLVGVEGEATLHHGELPVLSLKGRVYHDRNQSTLPLHELGIQHWIWGRLACGDAGERIYYLLWPPEGPPEAYAIQITPDGGLTVHERAEVILGPERRAIFGVPYWDSLTVRVNGEDWAVIHKHTVVDNGPFYLRFLIWATLPGQGEAYGVAEAVRPDRVDLDLHRGMVKARVHFIGQENNALLPLMSGPVKSRLGRLFGQLRVKPTTAAEETP